VSLAIPYRHDVTWYLLGTGMTHMVCSVLIFSRETLVLREGEGETARCGSVYLSWTIGPMVGVLDELSYSPLSPFIGVVVIGPPVYIGWNRVHPM
jgi:hypothetical protein